MAEIGLVGDVLFLVKIFSKDNPPSCVDLFPSDVMLSIPDMDVVPYFVSSAIQSFILSTQHRSTHLYLNINELMNQPNSSMNECHITRC